jgi:hypothetical protein
VYDLNHLSSTLKIYFANAKILYLELEPKGNETFDFEFIAYLKYTEEEISNGIDILKEVKQ